MKVIRKYNNRRMYDTSSHRSISLERIKELVVANEPFKVVESFGNYDITNLVVFDAVMKDRRGKLSYETLRGLLLKEGSNVSVASIREKLPTMSSMLPDEIA